MLIVLGLKQTRVCVSKLLCTVQESKFTFDPSLTKKIFTKSLDRVVLMLMIFKIVQKNIVSTIQ